MYMRAAGVQCLRQRPYPRTCPRPGLLNLSRTQSKFRWSIRLILWWKRLGRLSAAGSSSVGWVSRWGDQAEILLTGIASQMRIPKAAILSAGEHVLHHPLELPGNAVAYVGGPEEIGQDVEGVRLDLHVAASTIPQRGGELAGQQVGCRFEALVTLEEQRHVVVN